MTLHGAWASGPNDTWEIRNQKRDGRRTHPPYHGCEMEAVETGGAGL